MVNDYEVVIVGGGLAGLTAAIHLKKKGCTVLVIEKSHYPHHKVCGEYVSNEVLPYLSWLGISTSHLQKVRIDTLLLSLSNGKSITVRLPLGGFGISRYELDEQLYQYALGVGVDFCFDSVVAVDYEESQFEVHVRSGKDFFGKVVLGAYGKRSNLDATLQRDFLQKKSRWVGIKSHYELKDFPKQLVGLHNFPGGYGGLSSTGGDTVNFCYLASYDNFKQAGDVATFNETIVSQNPYLADFLARATSKFDKPLAIAQISFDSKPAVENHMLMCGDSAGLIHPLCGNGMAMAIHSAKIASEHTHRYLNSEFSSRQEMESRYQREWNRNFSTRIWMGKQVQRLFLHPRLSETGIGIVAKSEKVIKYLITKTHGKPILT